MDIDQEKEAFEKECRLLCYKGNMVMSNLGSFYNNEQTNWMWQMWLSAKAQAVPEGFVLVSKTPSLKVLDRLFAEHDIDEERATYIYRDIINAQEPTND